MSTQRFDIVRQGLNITSGMKTDIVDLYKRALTQKQYQNKADYIRYHLEQKYGRCWCVLLSSLHSEQEYDLADPEHFLFELKSSEHQILVYLIPEYNYQI